MKSAAQNGMKASAKAKSYAGALSRELKTTVDVELKRARSGVEADGKNTVLKIDCRAGNHTVEIAYPQMFPPNIVRSRLQRDGWLFRHGATCVDCSNKEREEKREAKQAKTIATPEPAPVIQMPEPQPAPPAPEPIIPSAEKEPETMNQQTAAPLAPLAASTAANDTQSASAKAKAAQRAVLTWLEESFEVTGEEEGRYKAGISDATIAKETGASEKVVAGLREQFYGRLAQPKEIDQLKAEIATITAAADTLVRDATATASELRRKADALSARLDQLAVKNGWVK